MMLLELVSPLEVSVYRTGDRTKLRIKESGQPGRLMLNLAFASDKECAGFLRKAMEALQPPAEKEAADSEAWGAAAAK